MWSKENVFWFIWTGNRTESVNDKLVKKFCDAQSECENMKQFQSYFFMFFAKNNNKTERVFVKISNYETLRIEEHELRSYKGMSSLGFLQKFSQDVVSVKKSILNIMLLNSLSYINCENDKNFLKKLSKQFKEISIENFPNVSLKISDASPQAIWYYAHSKIIVSKQRSQK